MSRTFTSGPAVPPAEPFASPPEIVHLPKLPSPPPVSEDPESVRLLMSGCPITVRTLAALLQDIVSTDPLVGDFTVDADGCDCIEPAFGIRVDLKRGTVLVARKGWDR